MNTYKTKQKILAIQFDDDHVGSIARCIANAGYEMFYHDGYFVVHKKSHCFIINKGDYLVNNPKVDRNSLSAWNETLFREYYEKDNKNNCSSQR